MTSNPDSTSRPATPGASAAAASAGPLDVWARLEGIDPAFRRARTNRFQAQLAQGKGALPLLLERLGDRDPAIRHDAAEALGSLGDTRALTPLRALLRDPEGGVRTAAAVALIRVGDQQLFPEVVKALRHEDPQVVIGAAVALGYLADRRVVPNLVEAFKTDNVEVGAAVAWALGQCKDAAALPWLITAVEQGFAVANACEALGRIGDARAQGALLRALDHNADDVRAYAARALGLLQYAQAAGGRGQLGLMAQGKALPKLRRLLTDRSRKVRLCAAIALYELGEQVGGRQVVRELGT